jgi:hypothetical protein
VYKTESKAQDNISQLKRVKPQEQRSTIVKEEHQAHRSVRTGIRADKKVNTSANKKNISH